MKRQTTKKIMAITTILLIVGMVGLKTSDDTTNHVIVDFFDTIYDGFSNIWNIEEVTAPTEDQATGSFYLNAAPTVTGVNYEEDGYGSDEALDPVTVQQRVNFTLETSAYLDDLLNATIWIFDDSEHGANYNETAEDGIYLVSFLWTEATNTFTVNSQGSMTEWAVDDGNSDKPADTSAVTTFEFSMRFTISQVARADTSDWNCTVHVYDDDAGTAEWDYASESALVTMNSYFSLEYSDSGFTWGSDIQPNSVNNTHASLTVTAFANAQWELQINATDFNSSGESDVLLSNDILCWDADGSAGGSSFWIRTTIATATDDWDNQGPMSDENGLSRDCNYFLSPAELFIVGKEWNTTVSVWIQANT